MSNLIGKTILHYRILEHLGQGGMGVVYKAKDTKLDREVALKFLPIYTITSKEEKTRFEQEAKAAAKLSHANIATVHAIDEVDGQTFIAMEYVDGKTLSDMVEEQPLKIKDAIKIARQIAEGLHAAHEQGIVHRDIKSANIMITAKGAVKIMDFGLAKLSKASMMTKAGTTLGTISYMSPEQTQGEKVDHRSDIWSLGVVMYEMISGQLPFKGDYESAIIYSIMNEVPEPLTAVRSGVPMDMEKIVNKCLAKDPGERYQNIVELPVDLKNVSVQDISSSKIGSSAISTTLQREKELTVKVKYSHKTALTVAVSVIVTFLLTWFLKPGALPPQPRPVNKITVPLPEDLSFRLSNANRMAISPDGTKMVFMSDGPGNRDYFLHMKRARSFEIEALVRRNGARSPFFSPDGRWVGYFDGPNDEIWKISVDGGEPLMITKATRNQNGATWAPGNTIIFAGGPGGLRQVPESGGEVTLLTKPGDKDEHHAFPHILPGGRSVLFTIQRGKGETLSDFRLAVYTFGDDGYRIILDEEGYNGVYSPTGHILYGRSNRLMAVPFDVKRLQTTGVPAPVLDNVATHSRWGGMSYALSREGTIIYTSGTGSNAELDIRSVLEVDLSGQSTKFFELQKEIDWVRYSPDGRYVGFVIDEGNIQNIWIYYVDGGAMEQLTHYTDAGVGVFAWSPDSKRLAYPSGADGTRSIYVVPVDGSEAAKKIYTSPLERPIYVYSWTSDGHISFDQLNGEMNFDIFVYSFKDSSAKTYLSTPNFDGEPVFSPNGKWIAYASNVTGGGQEVYVRPFPLSTEGYWKISTDGGGQQVWSPDGKKIYYRNGDTMYAVDVTATDTFTKGEPRKIFEGEFFLPNGRRWDIHPDGDHFLMLQQPESRPQEQKLYVIQNFFEEIKRLVPVEKH